MTEHAIRSANERLDAVPAAIDLNRQQSLGAWWRTRRLHVVNLLVLFYTVAGWLAGIGLILLAGTSGMIAGILLVAHTTVWSALLTHEFMHGTMFRDKRTNQAWGKVMTLISGACAVSYGLLRTQHMEHHRNRVGYDGFSITRWYWDQPILVRKAILAAEYLYIPVLSMVARCRSLCVPLLYPEHRDLRRRILVVLALRMMALAVVLWIKPVSLFCLAAAYILTLTIFRIYDCFHHTFDIVPLGSDYQRPDRNHELANTYSSLISRRYPWLNWIFLNYGYHNAHHYKHSAHWTELSQIDHALYGSSRAHCIVGLDLLRWYHRHRLDRIRSGLGAPTVDAGYLRMEGFRGIIMNISFISYDV